jgi:hypothetical protein
MPVPDFSPGEVLTAAAMDSIGLWKIQSDTFTSLGTAGKTYTVFNADFLNYRIMLNVFSASNNTDLTMRMAVANNHQIATLGLGVNGSADNTASTAQASFAFGFSLAATTGRDSFAFDVFDPFTATTATEVVYSGYCSLSSFASTGLRFGAGLFTATQSLTGFHLAPTVGTINGTISIYGYRD